MRFPWWPWCTDVRARVSIFSMNYPPTWSIPHWNLVINGSICWQMFLWLEDWRDLLFRAACNWNCFEGLPACDVKSGDHVFNVLWLMGCLAHFVSFDSCDSLKNEREACPYGIPTLFCRWGNWGSETRRGQAWILVCLTFSHNRLSLVLKSGYEQDRYGPCLQSPIAGERQIKSSKHINNNYR